MVRKTHRFSGLGIIVWAGLLLAACQPQPQVIAPDVPGIGVAISGNTCPGVVVRAGDPVTWMNQDRRDHSISHVPEAGGGLFHSGVLKPQDSFTFTFLEPGTYSYSCTIDGAERGTVTVEE